MDIEPDHEMQLAMRYYDAWREMLSIEAELKIERLHVRTFWRGHDIRSRLETFLLASMDGLKLPRITSQK